MQAQKSIEMVVTSLQRPLRKVSCPCLAAIEVDHDDEYPEKPVGPEKRNKATEKIYTSSPRKSGLRNKNARTTMLHPHCTETVHWTSMRCSPLAVLRSQDMFSPVVTLKQGGRFRLPANKLHLSVGTHPRSPSPCSAATCRCRVVVLPDL